MAASLDLPSDFGARVRAARAYKDDLSRQNFAGLMNTDGASASTIKNWEEHGKLPPSLSRPTLVQRLAEVSGLPESFFWGDPPAEADAERLSQIEDDLRALRAQVTIGAAEALQRIEEGVETILRSLPPPPR